MIRAHIDGHDDMKENETRVHEQSKMETAQEEELMNSQLNGLKEQINDLKSNSKSVSELESDITKI